MNSGFYLSHHAVFKESSNTTKLRVVFDASAKPSKRKKGSLNDHLLVGPTIQDDLFTHLLRFRTHPYVILADIEKMYRQFLVREEDRIFQKLLLFNGDTIQEHALNTVTYFRSVLGLLSRDSQPSPTRHRRRKALSTSREGS